MPDWDERYRRGEHASIAPSRLLVRVADMLATNGGRRALDIACGAGRHAIFLAERGWQVTAVDASPVGIELTKQRARERGVTVETIVANLERGEFTITPDAYDLICVFYYLQRNLFPHIRAGVHPGGTVVAAIHLTDESPDARPMNPAFLLQPGELSAEFQRWEITHYHESQLLDDDPGEHHRRTAEIIAQRPLEQ